MRVRTGRVLRSLKDHHRMATFNAGCETNRQSRFTHSGAVRPLRSARLSRCRRFGPSPCPTHYSRHLATMPSADFCPVTSDVTARCAAWIALGSGGHSIAFAMALSPAPLATTETLGFDGDSVPFGPALRFDSHSRTGRMLGRSPRIRT
jgi:hypothetical protein